MRKVSAAREREGEGEGEVDLSPLSLCLFALSSFLFSCGVDVAEEESAKGRTSPLPSQERTALRRVFVSGSSRPVHVLTAFHSLSRCALLTLCLSRCCCRCRCRCICALLCFAL